MQPNACAIRKVREDMVPSEQSGANGEPPGRRNDLPPEILEILWPALQVGGLSGMSIVPLYPRCAMIFSRFRDSLLLLHVILCNAGTDIGL
jgi:hypothetical protein